VLRLSFSIVNILLVILYGIKYCLASRLHCSRNIREYFRRNKVSIVQNPVRILNGIRFSRLVSSGKNKTRVKTFRNKLAFFGLDLKCPECAIPRCRVSKLERIGHRVFLMEFHFK